MPLFRHRNSLADYFNRESRRMAEMEELLDRVNAQAADGTLPRGMLQQEIGRMRRLAEDQRTDRLPDPRYEAMKFAQYRIMEIQVRKLQDVLDTGGANSGALAQEEAQLAAEFDRVVAEARLAHRQVFAQYGIEPPD